MEFEMDEVNKIVKQSKKFDFEKAGYIKKENINIAMIKEGEYYAPKIIFEEDKVIIKYKDEIIGIVRSKGKFPLIKSIGRNDLVIVSDGVLKIYRFKNINKRENEGKFIIQIENFCDKNGIKRRDTRTEELIRNECRIGDDIFLVIQRERKIMVLPNNKIAFCLLINENNEENKGIIIKKVINRKIKIESAELEIIKSDDIKFEHCEGRETEDIKEDILIDNDEEENSNEFGRMISKYWNFENEALENAKNQCESLKYSKMEKNRLIIKDINKIHNWENKIGYSVKISGERNNFGVITGVKENYIKIDFKDDLIKSTIPMKNGEIEIDMIGDEVAQRRREEAIKIMENNMAPMKNLAEVLTCEIEDWKPIKNKKVVKEAEKKEITINQIEAIEKCLNTPEIFLIQGPPGTGKTTVIREIVKNLIDSKESILISAFQNLAVDNVLEGFLKTDIISYRFGKGPNETMYKICNEIVEEIERNIKNNISNRIEEKLEMFKEILKNFKKNIVNINNINELKNIINEIMDAIEEYEGKSYNYILCRDLRDTKTLSRNEVFNKEKFIEILPECFSYELEFEERLNEAEKFLKKINRSLKNKTLENIISKLYWLQEFDVITEISDKDYQKERIKIIDELKLVKKIDNNINEEIFDIKNKLIGIVEEIENKLPESVENKEYKIVKEFKSKIINNKLLLEEVLKKFSDLKGTTCQKVGSKVFNDITNGIYYEYVIIDEAARANPLDLLIPLIKGKKIILVGDHKQLPHLIEDYIETKFQEAEDCTQNLIEKYIKESLFGRLYRELPDSRKIMLNTQFRMNSKIGNLVSNLFYDGILETGTNIKNDTEFFHNESLIYWDVKGHQIKKSGGSYINKKECEEILEKIKELDENLKEPKKNSIGIISFYKAQVDYISEEMRKLEIKNINVSVGTVDSYQGLEKEIIIISTVRTKGIGFTANPNRLNVALSRAKKAILLVGDKNNMKQDNLFKEIYENCVNGRVL